MPPDKVLIAHRGAISVLPVLNLTYFSTHILWTNSGASEAAGMQIAEYIPICQT